MRPISPRSGIGRAGCARGRSGPARSAPAASSARRARSRRSSAPADRGDARRPRPGRPRRASMQPPAARRRPAGAVVHPGERIEHLEEEHEGGDQQPLGPGARSAASAISEVSTRPPASARATRPAQVVRRRGRCRRRSARGIRESRAAARSTPWLTAHSLPVHPAAAARRKARSADPARASRSASARAARPVPSLALSSTSMIAELPRDSPGRAASRWIGDHVGLVAGRYDGGHRRPIGRLGAGSCGRPARRKPEPAVRREQPDPDQERRYAEDQERRSLHVPRPPGTRPERRRSPRDRAGRR